ncbi:MAG: hypothetical protein HZA74_02885 [Ignavibacteriales bacterium]|nr:hypothetical protein [Ignavibacteriales bacterium]
MKYLSKNILEKLSHPKSFERGEKYYKQGRVVEFYEDEECIKATVIGTDNYHILINQNKWEHTCDCLSYRDDRFCKHEIAVLLTKLYGKVEAKNKPKIKLRNSEKNESFDDEFIKLLEKQSKETLINEINKLAAEFPVLKASFKQKYSDGDERHICNVESMLNKSISSLKRIKYGRDYSNKIFMICKDMDQMVETLPVTRQTSKILLNAGYNLTESLSAIDDSYGTIQNVIDVIIERSTLFLNSASPADLDIYYEFISKKSSFDLDFKIVDKISRVVKNDDILSEFITKLEKTLYRRDPDFNFSKEDVVNILMDFYETKNSEKYEELAKEYLNLNILVKLNYVKFLYNQKRYDELIEHGISMYDRYDIRPMINTALLSLGRISELIDLLKKQKTSSTEIRTFLKLKSIDGLWGSKEFEDLVDIMLKNCQNINDALDLLSTVERYSQIKDVLLKNSQHFNSAKLIEEYALKFSLYNHELAVELYKKLVEIELKKIRTSSYYKTIIEYLTMIKTLGEKDFVFTLSKKLIIDYPTKKKLAEELRLLCE